MIWIIATYILYLLIAGIALFLICSEAEPPLTRRQAYYDIRNIAIAIIWPAVLLWAGLVAGCRYIAHKTKPKSQVQEPVD